MIVVAQYHRRMTTRERLSASVETQLLAAGREAVAAGRAASLSAWVNEALRRQADHDRGLAALGDFIEAYEAEHGVITDEEMDEAQRWARSRAIVVRRPPTETETVASGSDPVAM